MINNIHASSNILRATATIAVFLFFLPFYPMEQRLVYGDSRLGQAYIFSPREVVEELRRERRRKRKTHETPSEAAKRWERVSEEQYGERYTRRSYAQAIKRGCFKASPPPEGLSEQERMAWAREHHWSPNQLRHNAATLLRKQFGLEAARAVLDHSSAAVTELYAELDEKKAADIMNQVG